MSNTFVIPKKEYKTAIRQVNLNDLTVGGENSLPFLHSEIQNKARPLVAIEIQSHPPANYPKILKEVWGDCINDMAQWAKSAVEKGADILAVRFNIGHNENVDLEIEKSQEQLRQILETINVPVIVLGSDKKDIDLKLLPALAKAATRSCTLGIITEDNYKEIIPVAKEHNHNVIARTPIDINLAKQLNILITEMGFDPDKILIDPNMGSLGYGLDYAYSVIERIKLAGLEGDIMLNMPIVTFVGEESWKAKEAKSDNTQPEWGNLQDRAIIWECVTASSIITAGANLVIMHHPDAMNHIKGFINSNVEIG
ncbi:MAG: hypothetical protein ACD_20C00297G0004 [uncultured bacterium]|nr:MAG: hypothetical protein ACD_20C00297G0004 [uncultured bacterium]HBH18642.1 acetyl-CoA decarbonylase/synthase complex subunit delta [Cyanobacteria bacterium UBA9579]